jgi:hypothetical protein
LAPSGTVNTIVVVKTLKKPEYYEKWEKEDEKKCLEEYEKT